MFSETRTFKRVFFFLLFQVSVWAIMSLAGCGGSGNIPPASVLSSGRVTLSWDEVPGAASYNVYLATSPGVTALNSYKIQDVSSPVTIKDLEPGTTYYFVVEVQDDSGESRRSREVSYTVGDAEGKIDFGDILKQFKPEETSIAPREKPVATVPATRPVEKQITSEAETVTTIPAAKSTEKPDSKRRSTESGKSADEIIMETRDVTLAWDNVPNAISYNIYWSDKPGVNRQKGTKISNVSNPYKMKGLIKGKKYYFVVTAVNASGESPESAEFSFTVGQ